MAENGPFGAPFLAPKIPPKKFMWVPFLRPFPGNEAHKFFFLGAQIGVFRVGAKMFMLKKFMCFFRPLHNMPLFGEGGKPILKTEAVMDVWAFLTDSGCWETGLRFTAVAFRS